jgi:hypothetical protein
LIFSAINKLEPGRRFHIPQATGVFCAA